MNDQAFTFRRLRRRLIAPFVVIVFVSGLLVYTPHSERIQALPVVNLTKAPIPSVSIYALYERQSKTLSQATSRYSLRTGRRPPPGYNKWFAWVRENNLLVDEYDQIHRDFEPFYQLAERDPMYFKRMVCRNIGICLMSRSKGDCKQTGLLSRDILYEMESYLSLTTKAHCIMPNG